MIKGLVSTGDIVQTYAYGKPYRVGEVLAVSMGEAQVRLTTRDVTWIHCDFLAVIVKAS